MESLSDLITKGASPKWQGIQYASDTTQTLFVTSENVREGYLDLEKEKYLENKINEIQKRSVLQKGDVLLNIVGASIGRSAIYNLEKIANTNQAVCIIRLKKTVFNEFICYFLNSNIAKIYYDDNKVETARANISLSNVSNMVINLPTLPEQVDIVRILDIIIEKENKAKQAAEAVLEQIDLLKKSILARAFREEL
ncbi:MAG: restriction endonuclease subunit S [Treponema sp.]|nr:restriction endonuclease subunit S [Treponema sp.]